MSYSIALTKEIEALAKELGARRWAVIKWRKRGIPPKWQLKLLEALDAKEREAAE